MDCIWVGLPRFISRLLRTREDRSVLTIQPAFRGRDGLSHLLRVGSRTGIRSTGLMPTDSRDVSTPPLVPKPIWSGERSKV